MLIASLENIFVEDVLTKEQTEFQKRASSLEKLREDYNTLKDKIEAAQLHYNLEISAFMHAYHTAIKERHTLLCEFYLDRKTSKIFRSELLEIIAIETKTILDSENSEEEIKRIKDLFARCHGKSYEHFEEEILKQAENIRHKMYEFSFGMSPDEYASTAEFEEAIENESIKFNNSFISEKAMKMKKEKATIEQKSLKEVYINLMKGFHPDTEMDEVRKLEKTEICKKVTHAYEKKDLYNLLYYEFQLMGADESRLRNMAREKLKGYNDVILKQKKEVESKLYFLKLHNEMIYRGMCTKLSKPDKFLNKVKAETERDINDVMQQIQHIKSQKGYLKVFIRNYLRSSEEEFSDFPF